MKLSDKINKLANKYRQITANNLSKIIKIPSFSGEEKDVVLKLKELCEEANFDEVRIDEFGNLIARIGYGKKVLAFDAHIDTVETGDLQQWNFDPFSGKIQDDFVLGRGSIDQKGGAASMITAGKILKELNFERDFSIFFTFTIMEEDCDGLCWKYLIEKEQLIPDFVVITEPTNLNIYRGHRGRMEIEIEFQGKSAHGSMPERGINAIYSASETALKIKDLNNNLRYDDFLGKGSIAVTSITSQSPSLCAIPDGCKIHLDKRLTWGESMESSIEEIEKILPSNAKLIVPIYQKESYRGFCLPQEKYFPTWKLDENHPLVQTGIKTYEQLFESDPKIDKWTFSTNAVTISGKYEIPTIGFGPGNEIFAHTANEKMPISHLEKASAFYAFLAYELKQ